MQGKPLTVLVVFALASGCAADSLREALPSAEVGPDGPARPDLVLRDTTSEDLQRGDARVRTDATIDATIDAPIAASDVDARIPTDLATAAPDAPDATAPCLDGDGDGHCGQGDCDDADPDRNPGSTERCNSQDDDCDGAIDEGIDMETNVFHCGTCDSPCLVELGQPACVEGRCGVRSCDRGFADVDGLYETGCEYACHPTRDGAVGLEACDLIDNDCDGEVDEGYDHAVNGLHCGACGTVCDLNTERCEAGLCAPSRCDPGTYDVDGLPGNGCEYACVALGDEVCDGDDGDCDGRVDEDTELATDAFNCGACARVCDAPNGRPACALGVCRVGSCDHGWSDADADPVNGCEHPCLPTREGREVCDGIDNDCDARVDEDTNFSGDPNHCGRCGYVCSFDAAIAFCRAGECGVAGCLPGRVNLDGEDFNGCEYRCTRSADAVESCDGEDDDCDGSIDEGIDLNSNVDHCGVCFNRCQADHGLAACQEGTCAVAACDYPFLDADGLPDNGCEYACLPTRGGLEFCDSIDNDCDGRVDEAFPRLGEPCGVSVGQCEGGAIACVDGLEACAGGVLPTDEACDGLDQDCDGATDETFPQRNEPCGSDVGECVAGRRACPQGQLICSGEVAPVVEACNARDDDCDGMTDEPEPARGFLCPVEQWVFANYDGQPFRPNVQYNGSINCGQTCATVGLRAVGARFICNLAGSGPTEGCDAANDGQYGRANCDVWIDHGVRRILANGEDCTGNMANCVSGACSEGVTYHAIQCQCGP